MKKPQAEKGGGERLQSRTVVLSNYQWETLEAAAAVRRLNGLNAESATGAQRRPSGSTVLRQILDAHMPDLEAEIAKGRRAKRKESE